MKRLLILALSAAISFSAGAKDVTKMALGTTLFPGDRLLGLNSTNYLVMQYDGNLVLYTAQGTPLWNAGTQGTGGNSFNLQNDANLVIYKGQGTPANAVWNSGTQRYTGTPMLPIELVVDGASVLLRYAGAQGNSGDIWRRPVIPTDPTSCTKGNEYPICMHPGTSYQFTTKLLACSRTDADRQARLMGGVGGEC